MIHHLDWPSATWSTKQVINTTRWPTTASLQHLHLYVCSNRSPEFVWFPLVLHIYTKYMNHIIPCYCGNGCSHFHERGWTFKLQLILENNLNSNSTDYNVEMVLLTWWWGPWWCWWGGRPQSEVLSWWFWGSQSGSCRSLLLCWPPRLCSQGHLECHWGCWSWRSELSGWHCVAPACGPRWIMRTWM